MTETANIRNLPYEQKVMAFRDLLKNLDSQNETDQLNVFLLVNNNNIFGNDFFENENLYVQDIAEFIDLRQDLKEEIRDFCQTLAFWYLSSIASCDLTRDGDGADQQELPPLISAMFFLGSIPFFSYVLNNCPNPVFNLKELAHVKMGYVAFGELAAKHSIASALLTRLETPEPQGK